jgi:hypothetical protein
MNNYLSIKKKITIFFYNQFIVNFLARRHPNIQFHAIDFSDSIDYAIDFSNKHNIKNIKYIPIELKEIKSKNFLTRGLRELILPFKILNLITKKKMCKCVYIY